MSEEQQKSIAESDLWDRVIQWHKDQAQICPRVVTVMLILSALSISGGSNIISHVWPNNPFVCYLLTFVAAPAFFISLRVKKRGADTDDTMHSTDHSSTWSWSNNGFDSMSSSSSSGDLNQFHPSSSVNRSSPFYQG